MNKEIEFLSEIKLSEESFSNIIFTDHKKKINEIFDSLKGPTYEYSPQKTIENIESYLGMEIRFCYSELTSLVYDLSEDEKTAVATNLDRLIEYVTDNKNNIHNDIINIAIKLWDHYNLARCQIENIQKKLHEGADELKDRLHKELYKELYKELNKELHKELSEELHKELHEELHTSLYEKLHARFKGLEREYITILGIFAAIVLAFVGEIAFSNSVLQNMDEVSIYRLTFVILLLGFILINTINVLLKYISKLSTQDNIEISIKTTNWILGVLLFMLLLSWLISAHTFPAKFQQNQQPAAVQTSINIEHQKITQ